VTVPPKFRNTLLGLMEALIWNTLL